MIRNRDFVVFSDNWHGLPTSAIHLFRQVSAHNRVFWFNTIGRWPRPTMADAGKVWNTMRSWMFGSQPAKLTNSPRQEQRLHVLDNVMIPIFKRLPRRWNQRLFAEQYRRVRRRYNIRRPIVVTTLPCAYDFLHEIHDAGPIIYYCVDDFLNYPRLNHADWSDMEDRLLDTVDGLVVSSRELVKKHRRNCPMLYLPHGVDTRHFCKRPSATTPARSRPQGPVVGFFGLIDEWVDLDAIADLGRAFPNLSFVLIGKTTRRLRALTTVANVYHFGFKPYAELPAYASCFDIGLIPFADTPLTRAANPLKLLEYFSMGLPVLATYLPELESQPGPIWMAHSRQDLVRHLECILRSDLAALGRAARRQAHQNTWQQRATVFADFISRLEKPSINKRCLIS